MACAILSASYSARASVAVKCKGGSDVKFLVLPRCFPLLMMDCTGRDCGLRCAKFLHI